jgi:hypothetical protein
MSDINLLRLLLDKKNRLELLRKQKTVNKISLTTPVIYLCITEASKLCNIRNYVWQCARGNTNARLLCAMQFVCN